MLGHEVTGRTNITNAIDGFTADSRGFTNSSRGYTRIGIIRRIRGWVHNGFATDSREFARVTVSESSREFARVHESSQRMRGRIHNGYTADSRIDADSRTDSQWVHKGCSQCSQFTAVNPSMTFDRSALQVDSGIGGEGSTYCTLILVLVNASCVTLLRNLISNLKLKLGIHLLLLLVLVCRLSKTKDDLFVTLASSPSSSHRPIENRSRTNSMYYCNIRLLYTRRRTCR